MKGGRGLNQSGNEEQIASTRFVNLKFFRVIQTSKVNCSNLKSELLSVEK